MSVCEPNYWDTIINGVSPGDKEFADLFNILDFPLESLEGDELNGDWDASKFQSMGPIPTDTLTGLTPVSQGNDGDGSTNRVPSYCNPFDRKFAKKELPKYVEENKGTCTPGKNLMSSLSNAFRTPSPVSVLESSGSCSFGKSLSVKSEIVIPVRPLCKRARSKRSRPSINPWLEKLPVIYAASALRKTSNTGKKKMKMSQLPNPLEAQENSYQQAKKKLPQELDAMEKKPTKKCMHCEVTKTPQWREGPYGPKTLCNACGVRYRSGRLFPEYRPAASPTFVPSVHSNSHKKVVEMRQKAMPPTTTVAEEELSFSPMPEFDPMSSCYEANYMY